MTAAVVYSLAAVTGLAAGVGLGLLVVHVAEGWIPEPRAPFDWDGVE